MICPECNGRGEAIYYVETYRDENSVTMEQRKGICRTCNGSGEKPQTNADRIRAMSDEELAEMLVIEKEYGVAHEVYYECPCGKQFDDGEYKKALEYTIAWLKQPVEE